VNIRKPRPWELPAAALTPERAFLDRRAFLKAAGLAGAGLVIAGGALGEVERRAAQGGATPGRRPRYPARRDRRFVLDRPLTDEAVAASHNNFYEFTEDKARVRLLVDKFQTRPWRVRIEGLVERPREIDLDELVAALPLEERLYRHRCVEAWAMAVPWTGIPMREFVKWARPTSAARFVRMVSFLRPAEAPNQKTATWYRWPYYEGLRLDEATHELALLAVGIYGHDLPKQHGAPLRLVTPWKYGFKSIKSITRFEFTDRQPATFWNDVAPREYDFAANVDPRVPHPRWSQATERMIGTGETRPTLAYNGYGEWVAGLYPRG
jgi:sulfoxide reductase catalytic subunit YedY